MSKSTNKTQNIATISLAIMAIGFVATLPMQQSFWGALFQGGFEAGLVGGLADWFAVTALFRHPMGVPIPHTALLPKNRDRITASIISMLENNWLTKESIRKKIADFQFTEKLFALADKEIHSPAIQKNSIYLIKHLIDKVDIEKIAPFVEKELKSRLSEWNIKNVLPGLIDQIAKRKYDEKTLDYILKEIDEWSQKEDTKTKLGRMALEAIENVKADGFMQFALKSFSNLVNEERLGNIIQSLIQKAVHSYQDPFNLNRQTLLFHIHKKLENLKTDEKLYEEINALKAQLISDWKPNEQIVNVLQQLKDKAIDMVEQPFFFAVYVEPLLRNGLDGLKNDEKKVVAMETWLKKQVIDFVEKNHSKIGKLVAENLEKLDNETLIQMLETNIGKDLQWIRVNGAVCGFFIGLLLVGIRSFF
jgi:uncharacterized membrane-anchored protein YjiN (DUF445 family)